MPDLYIYLNPTFWALMGIWVIHFYNFSVLLPWSIQRGLWLIRKRRT